jgi:hypothetical protein
MSTPNPLEFLIYEPIPLQLKGYAGINPKDYDLDMFKNESDNKFVRRDDFKDPEAMFSEEEAQEIFDEIIIDTI